MVVVGNKIDRTEEEAVGYNEVKQYAESIGAMFKLTSAKDGKGINVTSTLLRKSSPLRPRSWRSCRRVLQPRRAAS